MKSLLWPFIGLFMAKVRPEWGNGKSPCGNDDVAGVSASATPSDRRKFWSSLKAGGTGEVRQEPNGSFPQKKKKASSSYC